MQQIPSIAQLFLAAGHASVCILNNARNAKVLAYLAYSQFVFDTVDSVIFFIAEPMF